MTVKRDLGILLCDILLFPSAFVFDQIVVDLDQIVYLKERGVITEGGVGRVHFQFILIPVNLQSVWS